MVWPLCVVFAARGLRIVGRDSFKGAERGAHQRQGDPLLEDFITGLDHRLPASFTMSFPNGNFHCSFLSWLHRCKSEKAGQWEAEKEKEMCSERQHSKVKDNENIPEGARKRRMASNRGAARWAADTSKASADVRQAGEGCRRGTKRKSTPILSFLALDKYVTRMRKRNRHFRETKSGRTQSAGSQVCLSKRRVTVEGKPAKQEGRKRKQSRKHLGKCK